MLVLSRKQNETIVFPNLGVSVEILRVSGRSVSIGIRAPEQLKVLRGELVKGRSDGESPVAESSLSHALRNRLNQASLALHLAQKQVQAGRVEDAEKSMAQALESFAELDRLVAATGPARLVPQHAAVEKNTVRPRALLVEDDANERELLAGYLRLSGFQVATAEDGLSAVAYLEKQQEMPGVVVMDMQMPRMNGRQMVQTIRSNPKWNDIQLIVVSGTQQTDSLLPTGQTGVNRWFDKPLRPDDLVKHLVSLN